MLATEQNNTGHWMLATKQNKQNRTQVQQGRTETHPEQKPR